MSVQINQDYSFLIVNYIEENMSTKSSRIDSELEWCVNKMV